MAVLGLALLALGIDRFVLGYDPVQPVSADVAPAETVAGPARTTAPAAVKLSNPADAIGHRLVLAAVSRGVGGADQPLINAFRAPAAWFPDPAATGPRTPAAGTPKAEDYKLTTIISGTIRSAVINGVLLRVGQEDAESGITLIAVHTDDATGSVEIDVRGHRLTLTVDDPRAKNPGAKVTVSDRPAERPGESGAGDPGKTPESPEPEQPGAE